MKKCFLVFSLILIGIQTINAQITRIDPAFWYIGMHNNQLQLCVYGPNIADYTPSLAYAGVQTMRVVKVENPNYLFIYLTVGASTKPGTFPIKFTNKGQTLTYNYTLRPRTHVNTHVNGFTPNDIIYMLMPDRFSNGDTTNDVVAGMREQKSDVNDLSGRHGGDIQGIVNHLDYIKDLGATAVWCTPLFENDGAHASYHGYAFTDLYKVDPRFGTNDGYVSMVSAAHTKGLKIVMDYVFNHWGSEHYMIRDMPAKDFVHQWPKFTRCTYRPSTDADIHGSAYDRKINNDGWFDSHMPDMNQSNPLVADYMIQNFIWWVEYSGIDGYRIDTYPYCDNDFMNTCLKRTKEEYPGINIVGETWDHDVPIVAYWQEGSHVRIDGKKNELPSVTDFPWTFSIKEGLTNDSGWSSGLRHIYYTVAQDMCYGNPNNNLIFLDNHDMDRFFSVIGEDTAKWKLAITMLLTMRGIPQVYYGTELQMKNFSHPDGKVREDFPGGWPHDTVNKFTAKGRTQRENSAFNFVQTLCKWRTAQPWFGNSKMMQYVPNHNVYIYARYDGTHCTLVIINNSNKPYTLEKDKVDELIHNYTSAEMLLSGGQKVSLKDDIVIEPHAPAVLNCVK